MIDRFPPRYHFLLLSIKDILFGGWKKYSYSQGGEDLILRDRIFRDKKQGFFRDKKKGFYVDVGASHPLRGSNTHLLYKRGWSGINIEPNPNPRIKFLFKLFRSRDINVTAGIANKKGLLDYFMFTEIGVNTFDKQYAQKKEKKVPLLEKIKVPVYPLSTILGKYEVSHIDLLNIDTEGFDLIVLESNDWTRWKPTVIIVEDISFDFSQAHKSPVYNFLTEKGYKLFGLTGKNLMFKNKQKF